MKLTKKLVEDTLNALIGTTVRWNAGDVDTAMNKLFREYEKVNNLPEYSFKVNKHNKSWYFDILYKGYQIGGIDVHRTKGKTHSRGWYNGGSYADYTYKSFDVWVWNSPENTAALGHDVEERIIEIDKCINKKIDENKIRIQRVNDIVKYIKDTYNVDSSEVRSMIEYMYKHKWDY